MRVVLHEGTWTWMNYDECIIVDVPDDVDDIDEFLGNRIVT